MKNNGFSVVQINGFSGILLIAMLVTGLAFGFIFAPVWLIMKTWNVILASFSFPKITILQAALLWSAVLLSMYIIFKNSISIRVQKDTKFSPVDMKEIISEIKEKSAQENEKSELK